MSIVQENNINPKDIIQIHNQIRLGIRNYLMTLIYNEHSKQIINSNSIPNLNFSQKTNLIQNVLSQKHTLSKESQVRISHFRKIQ